MGKKEDEAAAAGCGLLLLIALAFAVCGGIWFVGTFETERKRQHEYKMEELRLKYEKEQPK